MKKIIKWILIGIETVFLFIAIGGISTAIVKNIYADVLIEQFKKKGTLDESKSTELTKVYPIESKEDRPTMQHIGSNYYPGDTGDILISLTSEIRIPLIEQFISFFAGGHAAFVLGDYQDCLEDVNHLDTIESTGLEAGDNTAAISDKRGYWVDASPYDEVICLRVKMNDRERKKVLSEAMALLGDPYNYAFIWDTDQKSYCSDLISKVFKKIDVNLNKDGFTTSVYDLLVSNESYISYYHYIDNNGVKHIYYLA